MKKLTAQFGLKNKTWLWLGLGVTILLLLAWFFGPDVAQAQAGAGTPPVTPPAGGGASDQAANAAYGSFLSIVLLLQELLNKILWPILFMIGGLMDNDFIFNNGMETRLFAIWVQIRNIVNILFVIALVGLALYNVLGIGGEGDQFSLKAVLPKLIIGIIAVNFSYLAIKVLLDTVNLGTTAIFSLPETVEKGLSVAYKDENQRELYQKVICENLYGSGGMTPQKKQKMLASNNISGNDPQTTNNMFVCEGVTLNKSAQQYFEKFGTKSASMVMAINMSKIAFIDKAALQSADSFAKISLNVLFSVVLYFVYMFSFLALFIILIARVVVIWLGVALSPFLMLSVALPGGLKEKLGILEKIKFTKHAFVPLEIAFPMSIGYMMLQAFQGVSFSNTSDFSLSVLTTGTLNIGVATSGLATLQDLLIAVVTIGVVWKGVFDAAEGTLAESIVGTIRETGESLGGFIAQAPLKYIPWVPVGQGAAAAQITPAALFQELSQFPGRVEQAERDKAHNVLKQFMPGIGGESENPSLLGDARSATDFETAVRRNYMGLSKGDKNMGEQLNKLMQTVAGKDILRGIGNQSGMSPFVEKLKNAKTPEERAKAAAELGKRLQWDTTATATATGSAVAATAGATGADSTASAGAAGLKAKFGDSSNDVKAVLDELDPALKVKAQELVAAIDGNNTAELDRLAADPTMADIEAHVAINKQKSSVDASITNINAAGQSTSEANQNEVAQQIRTSQAAVSSPEAKAKVKEIILNKVNDAAAKTKIEEYIVRPLSTATARDDGE